MALAWSCSPESIFLLSAASTSCCSSSRPRWRSAVTSSPPFAHSNSTPRSSSRRLSDCRSAMSPSMRRRRCITFCALAWSLQKVGAAMCFSMSASCSSRLAASKVPPEFRRAAAQLVVASFEVVEVDGHRRSPEYSSVSRRKKRGGDERDREISNQIADRRVDRAGGEEAYLFHESHLLKDSRRHNDPPVRIDDAADPGVRGARHISSVLDRPHRRHREMLIGRRRLSVPGIVGDRGKQLAALEDRLAHERGIDDLVADRGAGQMVRDG